MMAKKKKLISLGEHNHRQSDLHYILNSNEPRPNGIACPECGEEMMDSDPMSTLTSDPPQKNVHCPGCNYHGYRLA